jgi:hypothetical protein
LCRPCKIIFHILDLTMTRAGGRKGAEVIW